MSSRSQSPRGGAVTFGVLSTIGLFIVTLFWCCYPIGAILSVAIPAISNGEPISLIGIFNLANEFVIPWVLLALGAIFIIPNAIMCICAFLGTLCAILGYTRLKVFSVFNIIFGIGAFVPFILLLPWGIYFGVGFPLLLLFCLTPVGWTGFAFLFACWGSLIFAITSITAGSKGLNS